MLLDKMYKYEMDPTRTVGATERTRDTGQTDRHTDGQTEGRTDGWSETNIPPNNFVVWGGEIIKDVTYNSVNYIESLLYTSSGICEKKCLSCIPNPTFVRKSMFL